MKNIISIFALAATLPVACLTAQTTNQTALSGLSVVPPNASPAIGTGTVVLNAAQSQITVDLAWSGLLAPATASHIHGPAGPGTNAAVLFPFSSVPGTTSGAIPQQTFPITPTQVAYLQSGLLYMVVHSSAFPGGEIRGQLAPIFVSTNVPAGIALAAQISWFAATNVNYQVQAANVLNSNVWFNVGGQVAGNNATNYYYDPVGDLQSRYYRVMTRP